MGPEAVRVVPIETALAASGLRVMVVAGAPSPWSQAVLAILHIKQVPFLLVRTRTSEPSFKAWKGATNLPVVLHDGEPARTGWAEILALSERLAPDVPLVPADPETRVHIRGLCHEVMGEGAMLWCSRLLAIDAGMETRGRDGFPLRAAEYLAPRYGYQTMPIRNLHERAVEVLRLLGTELERSAGPYYLGDRITALDLYSAAAINALVPLPDTVCPMTPEVRAAFGWMGEQFRDDLSPTLLAHRDFMVSKHFPLPIEL